MEQISNFATGARNFVTGNPKTTIAVVVAIIVLYTWFRMSNNPLVSALKKTFGTVGAIAVAATSVAETALGGFNALIAAFGPLGGLIVLGLVFTETGRGVVSSLSGKSFDALKRGGKALRDVRAKSKKFSVGIDSGDEAILDEAAKIAEVQSEVSDRIQAEAGSGDALAIERLETAFESHSESVANAFEELTPEQISEVVESSGEALEAEVEPIFEDIHPIP